MRLVIIDDHVVVREGLAMYCRDLLGCDVVGVAGSGAEGVQVACAVRPDVVVLDLGLPDMNGFAVAEILQREVPVARLLVLSGLVDAVTVWRVERQRLPGFVDKGAGTLAMIADALREVAAGRTYYSPLFRTTRDARRADPASFEKVLSATEQDVLALVGEGLTDAEIAARIGVARTTAQTHRSRILQKLGIKGSPKLVAFANQQGFTRWESEATLWG